MSTLLAKRFFRNWKRTDAAGNEVELAEACLCEASSLILFESKGVWLPDSASANPEGGAQSFRTSQATSPTSTGGALSH